MVGAKCEAEIITISAHFSKFFSSNDQDESIFNFSPLDLDFCLE